jgi:hypothetical protein
MRGFIPSYRNEALFTEGILDPFDTARVERVEQYDIEAARPFRPA